MEHFINLEGYHADLKNRCFNCCYAEDTETANIIKCEKIKGKWSNKNTCSSWKEKKNG